MKEEYQSILSEKLKAAKTQQNTLTRPTLTLKSLRLSEECRSDCTCCVCNKVDLMALGLLASAILFSKAASFDRTFLFHREVFPYFERDDGVLREGLSNAFFFLQEGDPSSGSDPDQDGIFEQIKRMARNRTRSIRWHYSPLAVGFEDSTSRFLDDDDRVLAYEELRKDQFQNFFNFIQQNPSSELTKQGKIGFELIRDQFIVSKPSKLAEACTYLLHRESMPPTPAGHVDAQRKVNEKQLFDLVVLRTSKRKLIDWLRSKDCLELTDFGSDAFRVMKHGICTHMCNRLQSDTRNGSIRILNARLNEYLAKTGISIDDKPQVEDQITVRANEILSFLATWQSA